MKFYFYYMFPEKKKKMSKRETAPDTIHVLSHPISTAGLGRVIPRQESRRTGGRRHLSGALAVPDGASSLGTISSVDKMRQKLPGAVWEGEPFPASSSFRVRAPSHLRSSVWIILPRPGPGLFLSGFKVCVCGLSKGKGCFRLCPPAPGPCWEARTPVQAWYPCGSFPVSRPESVPQRPSPWTREQTVCK